jgi:hypothetical protein
MDVSVNSVFGLGSGLEKGEHSEWGKGRKEKHTQNLKPATV